MSHYFSENPKYTAAFEALRLDYIERLNKTVLDISAFENKISEGKSIKEDYESMYFLIHGLAGTGTTFGFPQITELAASIELSLKNITQSEQINLEDVARLKQCCKDAAEQNHKPQDTNDNASLPSPSTKFNILIIDDDDELSSLLKIQLEQQGIIVSTMPNGNDAIEHLNHHQPDLIVLDIMMPGMDGHEVLKTLKSNVKYKSTPVIMLTSRHDNNDISNAFDKGIIDYIVKPFEPESIMVKIKDVLEASRRTILVVESDPLVKDLIIEIYKEHGFNVVSCDKGLEAWKLITTTPPDLVIIDWMLPNMDALALMKNIKNDPTTHKIPFIILAAEDANDDAFSTIENRVIRPFVPRDLVKRSVALMRG
tara:strand:+ start:93 stop:1196 length:1104 start_codon:yes stop_codon:yes gene_type:complete